jgi:c-di-GMP-binding flagellar brake protein YcgR
MLLSPERRRCLVFQRRKFPRIGKNYRLSYTPVDKAQFENNPLSSLVVNISGGGLCFETEEALEKDSVVALEISSDDSQELLALARIAWCKPKGDSYEVGAEFWWIGWRDSAAQATIANFIAAKTAAQKVQA